MPSDGVLLLLYYVIGFTFILFLAHYVTKIIARKSNNYITAKNIKIIQSIRLDKNSKILIIIIYSKLYILGISNSNINLIDKFNVNTDDDKLNGIEKENINDFDQYLKNYSSSKAIFSSNDSNNLKKRIESIKIKLMKYIKKGDFSSDKEDKYGK